MRSLSILLLAVAFAAPAVAAQEDPPISEIVAEPQRPAKVRTATPAPAGTVQLEAGAAADTADFFTDLTFRFGISHSVDISLETSPYVRFEVAGRKESGLGDTVLRTKIRFFQSRDGSAAIEPFIKIPTANEAQSLGTGDTDGGFRFIASRAWGRNQIDFNLGGEWAGVRDAETSDAQWTLILTWSRTVGDRFQYFGEAFLQFLPAADVENVTMDWGFRYRFNPSFVFDGAVYIGITDDAPNVQLTLGVTKILGRMYTPKSRR